MDVYPEKFRIKSNNLKEILEVADFIKTPFGKNLLRIKALTIRNYTILSSLVGNRIGTSNNMI